MRYLLSILVLLSHTSGCGVQSARQAAATMESSNHLKQVGMGIQGSHDTLVSFTGASGEAQDPDIKVQQSQTAGRQIIYRASVNLNVNSFADVDRQITEMVNASGGFIASFREDRSYGSQRGGQWTVRLPAEKFASFLDAVTQLGIAERRDVNSQDVTEEYVDLNSRLKNKQTLEGRLLELVAKRGDEIKDVLALENELSRVREEIEKIQGRLRYLSDRVALTTVEISAYERLDYQPPEATFAQRIASTFAVSVDHLRQVAQGVVLAATALAPWVVVASMVLVPIGLVIRRRRGQLANVAASAT